MLAIPVASADPLEDIYRAPGYDYSWLTGDLYQHNLASLTADIAEADNSVQMAETVLEAARASLDDAKNEVSRAWTGYLAAYSSGDVDNAVEAWRAVGRALYAYATARDNERTKTAMLEAERENRTYLQFGKADLENDWREAQAARGIAGGAYGCGGHRTVPPRWWARLLRERSSWLRHAVYGVPACARDGRCAPCTRKGIDRRGCAGRYRR